MQTIRLTVCGTLCPLGLALGLGLAPAGALAAGGSQSQTITGTVQVVVTTPVAVTASADLRFGQFASPATAGTIAISATGTVTTSGGMSAASSFAQTGSGRGPGTFMITGSANQAFSVSMPSTITVSNGGATMTASSLTNGSFLNLGIGILDNTGKFTLPVGATLTVPASQAIGGYVGSYTLTVTYL